MIALRGLIAALLIGGSGAQAADRFAPVWHHHALVAGAGAPGFQDGSFYTARFRSPAGLCAVASRAELYVSDRGNDRIRLIRLDQNNRVETLAGSGAKGNADGPADRASFNEPATIIALSDRLLLVNDEGNALFRTVDLESGTVGTLAGDGSRGISDGPARSVALGGVWNLAHVPADQAIYFTQPGLRALRRLDLVKRVVATVIQDDPRLPEPMALAVVAAKLFVADRSGRVFQLNTGVWADRSAPPPLAEFSHGREILAMAASGNNLYAIQAGAAATWICLSRDETLSFPSVWGQVSRVPYLSLPQDQLVGFVADSRFASSFFLTAPALGSVLQVKDYRFSPLRDSGEDSGTGLVDFDYPTAKPARTFRVLLLGDSRMNLFDQNLGAGEPRAAARIETVAKRLELMLATQAALDGAALRYEVLSLTLVSWEPLLVWPAYRVPALVKAYDVDLVLLMLPPATTTLDAYIQRPITEQGIPAAEMDPEYLLQPLEARLKGNPAAKLVARLESLGWATPQPQGALRLVEHRTLLGDAEVRRGLLDLFARPLGAIRDGLARAMRPGGETAAFTVCYFPLGMRGSGVEERDFWKELCEEVGVSWLDLLDPFVVLKETWYPLSGVEGFPHFTSDGHALLAFVLAHELIRNGIVPFSRSSAAGPSREVRAPRSQTSRTWTALALASLALGLAALLVVRARRNRGRSRPPNRSDPPGI